MAYVTRLLVPLFAWDSALLDPRSKAIYLGVRMVCNVKGTILILLYD
jgi:hypothetical protein